jgi:hypothetical protein
MPTELKNISYQNFDKTEQPIEPQITIIKQIKNIFKKLI